MLKVFLFIAFFAVSSSAFPCNENFEKALSFNLPDYVTDSDLKFIRKYFLNEQDVRTNRIISFDEDGSFDAPWALFDDGPPYYDGDKFIVESDNFHLAIREDSLVLNESGTGNRFWAKLQDPDNSHLYIWFETRNKNNNNNRSRVLYGSEGYKFVMGHFADKVKCVLGEWVFGDNLEQFNFKTLNSLVPLENAAQNTWSGQQARKYGFTEVSIISTKGVRAFYSSVQVKFCKP